MRIALLAPITRRIPPSHYGPLEQQISLLAEGLLRQGMDVTLFAAANSTTAGKLSAVCPKGLEEDWTLDPHVWECLHLANLFDQVDHFDLVHNFMDYAPLTYSKFAATPIITTALGTANSKSLPIFKKYQDGTFYVSVSNADRSPDLNYLSTVYYGIDVKQFTFNPKPDDYLLYFGTIHHDQGAKEAIEIARLAEKKLIIAGVVQDSIYFEHNVEPYVDGDRIVYAGAVSAKKRSELMGGAFAMLRPINFDEPFGLSAAESMACGAPVIAFSRGSMPEIVDHGETGFLALNPGDAADRVKQIGEIDRNKCRRRVEEKFSVENMVAGYIDVYKQALERNRREERRPWGYFQVLSNAPDHKVKRVVMFPGRRLSLQRHTKRAEHWYLLHGEALVTRNGDKISLKAGQSTDIFQGDMHRIENTGTDNLVFIEVQTGSYLGEDDIERFEDDYGRIQKS